MQVKQRGFQKQRIIDHTILQITSFVTEGNKNNDSLPF